MTKTAIDHFADFVAEARVPAEARAVACTAYLDTIGVALAGAVEPAARAVQQTAHAEGGEPRCRIIGTPDSTGAGWASLANGTAAHALDYDDMCFVSLAHPSAPLVAAALAAGELARTPGRALLDAWVVGFEIEAVLGRAMNPRHYTQGWHCTSTLGTIGAAAAAARLLGLDRDAIGRCLAVAASEASGMKENFGTDAKPLHAGLAARNGIVAALLARSGLTASSRALDGPQGYLKAMGSERPDLREGLTTLGRRWEVLETGVTVKLYPSCAGTHPALDAVLDLRSQHGFTPDQVDTITIGVDPVTPTILLYDRPATGLEAKFSMPFCIAAAVVTGRVGLDTFEPAAVNDGRIRGLLPRISMTVDATLNLDAPALTQARVSVRLRDGRTLDAYADGARGYPTRPATAEELETKFRACAGRVLDAKSTEAMIRMLRSLDQLAETRVLTECLSPGRADTTGAMTSPRSETRGMAKWAQLRAGASIPKNLERGRWYRVETERPDGTVQLLGPQAAVHPLPEAAIRLLDRDPDFITRVQSADFQVIRPGERMDDLSYYGVCPREHFVSSLDAVTSTARCSKCNQDYAVQDELRG